MSPSPSTELSTCLVRCCPVHSLWSPLWALTSFHTSLEGTPENNWAHGMPLPDNILKSGDNYYETSFEIPQLLYHLPQKYSLPENCSRRNLRIFLTGHKLFACCQTSDSNWDATYLETLNMWNKYWWSKQVHRSAGEVCLYKDCWLLAEHLKSECTASNTYSFINIL